MSGRATDNYEIGCYHLNRGSTSDEFVLYRTMANTRFEVGMATCKVTTLMAAAVVMSACAGGHEASANQRALRDLVVSKVPIERAVAATSFFMGCADEDGRTVCSECQVTLHEDDVEYVAYATRYDHKIKYDEDGTPRFSVTSDLGSETFRSEGMALISPQLILETAESWCAGQVGIGAEMIRAKPLFNPD